MGNCYAEKHPSYKPRPLLRPMALQLSRLSSLTASFDFVSSASFLSLAILNDAHDDSVAFDVDRRPCVAPVISIARCARHGAGVPGIGHRLPLDEAQFDCFLFAVFE